MTRFLIGKGVITGAVDKKRELSDICSYLSEKRTDVQKHFGSGFFSMRDMLYQLKNFRNEVCHQGAPTAREVYNITELACKSFKQLGEHYDEINDIRLGVLPMLYQHEL